MKKLMDTMQNIRAKVHGLRENESGVASFVSLVFIILIIAIYLHILTFSANINRKIALQMAVDNAAHNAAVAQADILSRIAVVNQAIANTYVQNNRMHVDYLTQRYAFDILRAFWYDSNEVAELECKNACANHRPSSDIYDSNYKATKDNPDAITLDDIRKQIPENGTYSEWKAEWPEYRPLLTHDNAMEYGVSSCGFWDFEFEEQTSPSVIWHGYIATPDSMASITPDSLYSVNIKNIYDFVCDQINAGNYYENLKKRIINGSNNLTILNRELPRLVLLMDEYIYESVRKTLDGLNSEDMEFFIQIGNMKYPYSRNTPLTSNHFGQYNSHECFQVPDEKTFLIERGNYKGDFNSNQWGQTSFWQPYHENTFFNRYLDERYLPSIAFWHSWYFNWHCNGMMHCQTFNGIINSAPYIYALRQPESLRMGFHPNLNQSNDTKARPYFESLETWTRAKWTEEQLLVLGWSTLATGDEELAVANFINFVESFNEYKAQVEHPQVVHGRSDKRWASWEQEEGYELNCDYDRSAPAKPLLMREAMFGKAGSILIGASQPKVALANFGGRDVSAPDNLYAIAASRAGVRIPGDPEGCYTSSWYSEKKWNLFVDDWDAVMIPVARAWQDSRDLAWDGNDNSAREILSAMKQALGNPSDATFEEHGHDILH